MKIPVSLKLTKAGWPGQTRAPGHMIGNSVSGFRFIRFKIASNLINSDSFVCDDQTPPQLGPAAPSPINNF